MACVGDEEAEDCDGPEEFWKRGVMANAGDAVAFTSDGFMPKTYGNGRPFPLAKWRGSVDGAGRLQCSLSCETSQAIKSHSHACGHQAPMMTSVVVVKGHAAGN